MWIKLISPRSTTRPMDSQWKVHMAPPLSLAVVGALTPAQHRVTVVDENVERLRTDDRPDLVGLTVKVDTFYRACEIARPYHHAGVPVVMGGIHATACPEMCAAFADATVVGPAEGLWPRVLADAERRALQPVYRHGQPPDPGETPVPRWDLLRGKDYLFTNTLVIGRGCPWRCEFCYNSSPHVDARYRMKPVANVLREVESLGIRHVMFIDDNFIGDPDGARGVIEALRPLGLTWHTAVSADIGRREDLLDRMAESGCRSLFIGFESVNAASLRECRKGQNRIEEYDRTIAAIHARGMMVNASLVFGFDADDAAVFDATRDWLVRNRVATMTAHILTPYPGSRLYARLEAEKRIVDRDLRHYNTAHVVFRPARMSPAELEAGHRRLYREFYSWANIARRWPMAAGQGVAYLEFNLLYRKFGKLTCGLGEVFGMRRLATLATRLAYPSPDDPAEDAPGVRGEDRALVGVA